MKSTLIFIFFYLFTNLFLSANGQTAFERNYLMLGTHQAGISVKEKDGRYYTSSISDDCYPCFSFECFSVFDSIGSLLNNKVFSKSTIDESVGDIEIYGNKILMPIRFDSNNPSGTINKQVAIFCLDSIGQLLWQQTLGDTISDWECLKVVSDSAANIFAIVTNNSAGGILLFALDSMGSVITSTTLVGINCNYFNVQDYFLKNSKIYMTGQGDSLGFHLSYRSVVTISGNTLQQQSTGNNVFFARKIRDGRDGFFYSGLMSDLSGQTQVAILKCDTLGNTSWQHQATYGNKHALGSMCQLHTSEIAITGITIDSAGSGFLYVALLDSLGSPVWENRYCLPQSGSCYLSAGTDIMETADHMLLVCGQVQYVPTYPQMYLLKIDLAGNLNSLSTLPKVDNVPQVISVGNGSYRVSGVNGSFILQLFNEAGQLIKTYSAPEEFSVERNSVCVYAIYQNGKRYSGKLVNF